MPVPRRAGIGRRIEWNTRHFAHLLTGQDWQFLCGEGWGTLSEMKDDGLREAVVDMAACFAVHGHQLHELCAGVHHPEPPWFADYAAEPQKLIDEEMADPLRPLRMQWRANQESHPAAASPPAATSK